MYMVSVLKKVSLNLMQFYFRDVHRIAAQKVNFNTKDMETFNTALMNSPFV